MSSRKRSQTPPPTAAAARSLCARLVTRQLESLTDEQLSSVTASLLDLGIDPPEGEFGAQRVCRALLEHFAPTGAPVAAYAYRVLEEEQQEQAARASQQARAARRRARAARRLEWIQQARTMPACPRPPAHADPFGDPRRTYRLEVDPTVGPGAAVHVSPEAYERLFAQWNERDVERDDADGDTRPLAELVLSNGNRIYAYVTGFEERAAGDAGVLYVSPRVAQMAEPDRHVRVGTCRRLPSLRWVQFVYVPAEEAADAPSLAEVLPVLQQALPAVINDVVAALTRGMVFQVPWPARPDLPPLEVVVSRLRAVDEREPDAVPEEVWAARVPLGEHEVPFDVIDEATLEAEAETRA